MSVSVCFRACDPNKPMLQKSIDDVKSNFFEDIVRKKNLWALNNLKHLLWSK